MDIVEQVFSPTAKDHRPVIDHVALTWEQRQKSRHLPLEIDVQGLKTPYEPVLESYLQQQAIPVERIWCPLVLVNAMPGHRHP